MNARVNIPPDIQHRVLDRSRRRCALCIHFNSDWGQKEGQIAHLDQDRSNFVEDNLAFLCLPHHDDYDTKRRQTKSLTIHEVKTARDRLYKFIETGGDLAMAGQSMRGPTLEATRDSTIDATGALIPGDLPFQFARADEGGIISMPGIRVTRKEDGSFLVTPPSEPISDNPPHASPARAPETGALASREREDIARTAMIVGQRAYVFPRKSSGDFREKRHNEYYSLGVLRAVAKLGKHAN